MLELLKLLDTVSYDQKLHWRVMDHKSDSELDIYWNKYEDRQWSIQTMKAESLLTCSSRELLPNLEKLDIDPYEFELRLRKTVLQQVTFADLIINELSLTELSLVNIIVCTPNKYAVLKIDPTFCESVRESRIITISSFFCISFIL